MAGRQTKTAQAKRRSKSASKQSAERATQTWRQPPATPRTKIVRQETRTARAARPAARRQSWFRRINWRLIFVAFALTAAVSGLTAGILLGPFQVAAQNIEIIGARRIQPWEVLQAANVEGVNIFMLRPADVAARIEQVEGVSHARVSAHLPNRLVVEIREFLPLVAWQTDGGVRWLAEDGSLVPAAGVTPALTLTDPLGEAADRDGKLRKKVLENLTIIQQVRPDLNQLYYGKREGIYFRLPEGHTVYLGEEGQMAKKLALLEGMQRRLAQGDLAARTIDLRLEEFPTLK